MRLPPTVCNFSLIYYWRARGVDRSTYRGCLKRTGIGGVRNAERKHTAIQKLLIFMEFCKNESRRLRPKIHSPSARRSLPPPILAPAASRLRKWLLHDPYQLAITGPRRFKAVIHWTTGPEGGCLSPLTAAGRLRSQPILRVTVCRKS